MSDPPRQPGAPDATWKDPAAAWLAARGLSRETALGRDAAGRWYDGRQPIEHPGLQRAFDRWLDCAPDGRPCLRNDIHWVYVRRIEGPYFFVRGVRFEPDGRVTLQLSGDHEETLRPETLREARDGGLWCSVRGSLPARFDVESAQRLAERCGELRGERLWLRIGAWEGPLPLTDEPLRDPTEEASAD